MGDLPVADVGRQDGEWRGREFGKECVVGGRTLEELGESACRYVTRASSEDEYVGYQVAKALAPDAAFLGDRDRVAERDLKVAERDSPAPGDYVVSDVSDNPRDGCEPAARQDRGRR
jgi:hypothetical protein